MWGPDGWKKVVVCVVSDGRSKVNKRTLQVLSLVSCIISLHSHPTNQAPQRWDVTKKASPKTPLQAKMSLPTSSSQFYHSLLFNFAYLPTLPFRYTSSVIVTETGEVSQGSCPVQVIFCLKEQNKKKLNSHRWFFNAFGPLVKPNGWSRYFFWDVFNFFLSVCVLLDVGTKPTGTSIYELWKCFDRHSNVGGACGE
jgi:chitin synthase